MENLKFWLTIALIITIVVLLTLLWRSVTASIVKLEHDWKRRREDIKRRKAQQAQLAKWSEYEYHGTNPDGTPGD